jgi:PTH1 family peptidyl-tRNA hydrolase
MKLIVGLGNPGLGYANTRHNLGARAVKAIAKEYKAKLKSDRSLKSKIAKIVINSNECLLAIPNTYMNLSGKPVGQLIRANNVSLQDLLVIHDDVDLDLGLMRFKKQGSSGGHKGIDSIIDQISDQDFNRLKLGIGRGPCRQDTKDYVLTNFQRKEIKVVDSLLRNVVKACEAWVEFGLDRAMNEFN